MPVIYTPKGKAGEYAELAVNLYDGCSHGCTYCYAPSTLRKTKEDFNGNIKPRENILERLTVEAPNYKDKEIFLCFTCDPYQDLDTELKITRSAIEILKLNGAHVVILSKGGKLCLRDFDLLDSKDKVGATLTFIGEVDSLKWEPNASLPEERMAVLKEAKGRGIGTFASLEPVIDPRQTFEIIERSFSFIDVFKVGRWNYDPRSEEINWTLFAGKVVRILEGLKANYIIKEDLRKYL